MSEKNHNNSNQKASSSSGNTQSSKGVEHYTNSTNSVPNTKDNTYIKDFIAQYLQYRDEYYNQASDKINGRAMNLVEFTMQNLPPPSGPYKYDLDDPKEKILYDLEKNPQQSTRQYLEAYTAKLMSENHLKRKKQHPALYSSDDESLHTSENLDHASNAKSVIAIDNKETCTDLIILSDSEEEQEPSQTLVVCDSNQSLSTPSYICHVPSFYHDMIR